MNTRVSPGQGARGVLAIMTLLCVLVVTGGLPISRAAAPPPAGRAAPAAAPLNGLSLPTVENQLLSVVGAVGASGLPAATQATLLKGLAGLSSRLQSAEGISRQLDNKNAALAAMVQARLDAMVAVDKIAADLQINLDQLQATINANVNANVDASVGGITLTVKASADTIKADLGAKADRLLVDVVADLDVLKILTLHAKAHVDATRLQVTLHALVEKLTLDLAAVLADLKVLAKADVQAAVAATARLRVNIAAQVNGVRAQVSAGLDSRINLQLTSIAATTGLLYGILSSVSARLSAIQARI